MKKLIEIQNELKAPKSQWNDFGKYHYRSCEDILEALKPILLKQNCSLFITDELVLIGERYYIKATVTIKDCETNESVSNTAYAREEETKRGMDGSQITGTASSYARKYALNGMFLIDDTKDADTNEHKKEAEGKAKREDAARKSKITKIEVKDLTELAAYVDTDIAKICAGYKVKDISEMTEEQYLNCKEILEDRAKKKEAK